MPEPVHLTAGDCQLLADLLANHLLHLDTTGGPRDTAARTQQLQWQLHNHPGGTLTPDNKET